MYYIIPADCPEFHAAQALRQRCYQATEAALAVGRSLGAHTIVTPHDKEAGGIIGLLFHEHRPGYKQSGNGYMPRGRNREAVQLIAALPTISHAEAAEAFDIALPYTYKDNGVTRIVTRIGWWADDHTVAVCAPGIGGLDMWLPITEAQYRALIQQVNPTQHE